jgi:hypothetical protein
MPGGGTVASTKRWRQPPDRQRDDSPTDFSSRPIRTTIMQIFVFWAKNWPQEKAATKVGVQALACLGAAADGQAS